MRKDGRLKRIRSILGGIEMVKNKKETNDNSRKMAEKHIQICLDIKNMIKKKCENYHVYVATYGTGKQGIPYRKREEESGEEFWSINLWQFSEGKNAKKVKQPDVIVTNGSRVEYLIEVKWGTMKGYPKSDLEIEKDDFEKMISARSDGMCCRIHGPAVQDHQRYDNHEFTTEEDFKVDNQTKIVLVSDFYSVKTELDSRYKDILSRLKELENNVIFADINKRVGDIPSLQEVIIC